jgi:DNA-binding transcriptional regulator YdaS (Cro superfamily)
MTKQEAITFFGTQHKLAKALGLKQPAISNWGDIVPRHHQPYLEKISGGVLKAAPHPAELSQND